MFIRNFLSKRVLLIVGLVALSLFFASLLYLLFFKQIAPTEPPATPGTPGGLPTAKPGTPDILPSGKIGRLPTEKNGLEKPDITSPPTNNEATQITPLVETKTAYTTLDDDGRSLIYYQPDDGYFNRVTPNGKIERLTDDVFYQVQNVVWSPNRNNAVLEYPDGSNILYDFRNKKQVTLPKHWEEFSFNPRGDKLAFKSLGLDPDNRWLGISNIDGSNTRRIESLGNNANSVTVQWSPNNQIIALQHKPSGSDSQEIYFVGLQGENFRSMTVPGFIFNSKWTPDGSRLLYNVSSASSGYRPLLWVSDATGENIGSNRQSLSLNTWIDKCTFVNTERIICGVPESLPEGSGLTRSIADTIPDTIFEINLKNGQQTQLTIPSLPLTVRKLYTSQNNQWLFIEDAQTGKIYKINL